VEYLGDEQRGAELSDTCQLRQRCGLRSIGKGRSGIKECVAPLGFQHLDLVQHEVKSFELTGDLRLDIATKPPAIASLQAVELHAPPAAPKATDMSDTVQREQTPDAVDMACALGRQPRAFPADALGVLRLRGWNRYDAAHAGVPS
jgi:hypothetical protein